MRNIILTQEQDTVNKICSKVSFTKKHRDNKDRFVIGTRSLFIGRNPSIFYDDLYKDIYSAVDKIKTSSKTTIGGWLDSYNGLYYIDLGTTTNNLKEARKIDKNYNQTAIFDLQENKETGQYFITTIRNGFF